MIKAAVKLLATAGALTVLGLLARRYDYSLASIKTYIDAFVPWQQYLMFIALFVTISVIPIPAREVLKLLAAISFGWASIFWVTVGEVLAAIAGFWIGRWGGHEMLDLLFGRQLEPLNQRLQGAGWKTIVVLRVLPITPYRHFNFAAGMVDLRFNVYLAGSAIGILLRTAFYQTVYIFGGDLLVTHGVTTWHMFIYSMVIVPITMLGVWIYHKRRTRKKNLETAGA